VPIDVIDPLDGGVPRVRTPKVVVQADRVEKQVIIIGQGETPPKHAKCFSEFFVLFLSILELIGHNVYRCPFDNK
jgi:hypothetical protein